MRDQCRGELQRMRQSLGLVGALGVTLGCMGWCAGAFAQADQPSGQGDDGEWTELPVTPGPDSLEQDGVAAEDVGVSGWSDRVPSEAARGSSNRSSGRPPSRLEEARGRGSIRLTGNVEVAPSGKPPQRYQVRPGDTLWDVTGKFYGSPWEWPRVWSYNPSITNPHWIYPQDWLWLVPHGEGEAAQEEQEGPRASGLQVARRRGRAGPSRIRLNERGYIDRDSLAAAGVVAGSPEPHMLLSPYDPLYVQFAEGAKVKSGQKLSVFYARDLEEEDLDETEEGMLVRIYGTVRIDSYDPEENVARATVIQGLDPIERGYFVAPIPRVFEVADPTTNESDLQARIVASLRPRELIGTQRLVFVDAGAEQGVKVGNRMFVVHRGDPWRKSLSSSPAKVGATVEIPETPPYPLETVAEGIVVDVRPNSSALWVQRASSIAEVGDHVQMRKGY